MARKHRNKTIACPNCGTALRKEFEFCPQCGQENHDLRVPFRTFLYEFIENITHFDTKLWSTLKVIFTRPGQLTKDHVEGRRVRYVHPARFYVFISVIFFALLSVHLDRSFDQVDPGSSAAGPVDHQRRAHLVAIASDSLERAIRSAGIDLGMTKIDVPIDRPFYRNALDRLLEGGDVVLDSLLRTGNMEDTLPGTREAVRAVLLNAPGTDSLDVAYHRTRNGLVLSYGDREDERLLSRGTMTEAELDSLLDGKAQDLSWWERRAIRSLGRLDLASPAGRRQFMHGVVKAISVVMFILMPFTAVLLLWIFFRQRFYWEHLIFSVHSHTIYFLFFSLLFAAEWITGRSAPSLIVGGLYVWCALYFLLSLRRVYGRAWPATLWRSVLMAVPYSLIFTVLIIGGVLWGFFSL